MLLGRGKALGRKGLRGGDEVSVVARMRLKKVEKDLLDTVLEQKKVAGGARVTSIGSVVVELLRLAFYCLKEHGRRWTPPEQTPLSEEEAIAAGLTIVRKRSRSGRRRKKP